MVNILSTPVRLFLVTSAIWLQILNFVGERVNSNAYVLNSEEDNVRKRYYNTHKAKDDSISLDEERLHNIVETYKGDLYDYYGEKTEDFANLIDRQKVSDIVKSLLNNEGGASGPIKNYSEERRRAIEAEVDDDSTLPIISPRIIGGSITQEHEGSWMVSLRRFKKKSYWQHFCAGTLIHERVVLTAAHCVEDDLKGNQVWIGNHHFSDEDAYLKVNIKSYLCHEDFSSKTMKNDICLIILERPVWEIPDIIDVIGETENSPQEGEDVEVFGWGYTLENFRTPSPWLRSVELPVTGNEECERVYPTLFSKKVLCAGLAQGGKDSCQGDSGGPMIHKASGKMVGIVSWGTGCARPGVYGIYTNIAKYLWWMEASLLVHGIFDFRERRRPIHRNGEIVTVSIDEYNLYHDTKIYDEDYVQDSDYVIDWDNDGTLLAEKIYNQHETNPPCYKDKDKDCFLYSGKFDNAMIQDATDEKGERAIFMVKEPKNYKAYFTSLEPTQLGLFKLVNFDFVGIPGYYDYDVDYDLESLEVCLDEGIYIWTFTTATRSSTDWNLWITKSDTTNTGCQH